MNRSRQDPRPEGEDLVIQPAGASSQSGLGNGGVLRGPPFRDGQLRRKSWVQGAVMKTRKEFQMTGGREDEKTFLKRESTRELGEYSDPKFRKKIM